MSEWDPDKIRLAIARDLREIQHLYADLRAEAISHADDKDIPGGDAMVMLGPSADPEAWSYRQLSAALGRTEPHGIYENDADPQPPLLVLATWEDCIRKELGTETDRKATIEDTAKFLASSIDWCLDLDSAGDVNFIAIDDMAADIAKVRRRLETVLHDGKRPTFGVPCLYCGDKLLREESNTLGLLDSYRCLNSDCGKEYKYDQYLRAVEQSYLANAEWLTSEDMEAAWRIPRGSCSSWASGSTPKVRKKHDAERGRVVYNVADAKAERDRRNAEVVA